MTLPRALRQALTVARRDFTATVLTPAFLIFLLLPVFMGSLGAISSMGAASMAGGRADKVRMVAIAGPADSAALVAADARLRTLFGDPTDGPAPLRVDAPSGDPEKQARALIAAHTVDVRAVLYGPLDRPHILHTGLPSRSARYLSQLAEQALRNQRLGNDLPVSKPVLVPVARAGASIGGRNQLAFLSIMALFMLGILLTSQAIGTMMEERNNKVIEVLAAAVPLESVFLGKLLGMFGTALLFLGFWAAILSNAALYMPPDLARFMTELSPAVGGPMFALLFVAYFVSSYLLLGALFLTIGAQASTPRELQLLSLPVTILQVAMFGLSSAGAGHPDGTMALVSQIFPFSSPFAMIARAANAPELWPHLLALAWQALWVAATIAFGARWFRRGVLQSGSPRFRFGRKPA